MTAPERRRPDWSGDERSQLGQVLDFSRATVRIKATGLSDEQARQRLTPSPLTSIAGVVAHSCGWRGTGWSRCSASKRSPSRGTTSIRMLTGRTGTPARSSTCSILRELTDGATGE